jgi:hypothetical protein
MVKYKFCIFPGFPGHFWTVVPELGDKQTLRRRSRASTRRSSGTAKSAAVAAQQPQASATIGIAAAHTAAGSGDAAFGGCDFANTASDRSSASTSPAASTISSPLHRSPPAPLPYSAMTLSPPVHKPMPSYGLNLSHHQLHHHLQGLQTVPSTSVEVCT